MIERIEPDGRSVEIRRDGHPPGRGRRAGPATGAGYGRAGRCPGHRRILCRGHGRAPDDRIPSGAGSCRYRARGGSGRGASADALSYGLTRGSGSHRSPRSWRRPRCAFAPPGARSRRPHHHARAGMRAALPPPPLLGLPVTNEANTLLGLIRADRLVRLSDDEASEELLGISGAGEPRASPSSRPHEVAYRDNLATAFAALVNLPGHGRRRGARCVPSRNCSSGAACRPSPCSLSAASTETSPMIVAARTRQRFCTAP